MAKDTKSEIKSPAKEKTMFLLSRNNKRYFYVKKSELIQTDKPVELGSMKDSTAAIAPEATVEVIESLGKKLLKNNKADFINLSAKISGN